METHILQNATWLLLGLQSVVMIIDESWFHRRRGLPDWERWGHPLDSFFFLIPIGIATYCPPTSTSLTAYIVAAIFSSLFVTKDEWVHAQICSAGEHWLHALLFLLHGPIFISIGTLWYVGAGLPFQPLIPPVIMLFTFVQIVYWSIIKRSSDVTN